MALAVTLAVAVQSTAVASGATAIQVVAGVTQARPTTEAQAIAWDRAMQFARAHPKDIGYPWIDPDSGDIQLSAASANGWALLAAIGPTLGDAFSIRSVGRSLAELEAIENDVPTLKDAGIPHADLIYETAPDHSANRIVITIAKQDDQLLAELAARYGADAIAVRVDQNDYWAGSATRQADYSPFWGGSEIRVPAGLCSDGFSWTDGSYEELTAGHCAPNGGQVSSNYPQTMGTVTSGAEENWSTSDGTQYFTGQSVYRGDLALIRIYSDKSSAGYIYRGGPNSGSSSAVKYMWYRSPAVGDLFYTGGYASGELGTWTVTTIQMNKWYTFDGLNVWARNVTEGTKSGDCIQHGDSGGSVFTNTTGGVAAKGIISGMGFITCYVYFTDIRQAYDGLPGALVTA